MKKLLANWVKGFFSFLIIFLFCVGWVYSYDSQWFDTITDSSFVCNNQCFLILWEKWSNDFLDITWNFSWKWNIWYGFLNWNQVILWEFYEINWNSNVSKKFLFDNLNLLSQIPDTTPIALVIQWNLLWDAYKFNLWKIDSFSKLKLKIEKFFSIEKLTPYSINLRNWAFLGSIAFVKFLYYTFLFLFIIFIFFKQFRNKYFFIYLFLVFFSLILFRDMINYVSILNTWLKTYSFEQSDKKTYFDLWDYIAFTDKIRKELKLDWENSKIKCDIYVDSYQDWPYKWHWESVYLKPCNVVNNPLIAQYWVYYKKNLDTKTINWKILVDFNNSYLIQFNK